MKLLFCLNSFLFLIFLIFLECSFSIISPETIKQLQSHTFIGVYGFPNSGSDWIHEVLRFTPGVSTIHEGCAKKHGNQVEKQCTNSQYSVRFLFFPFSSFFFPFFSLFSLKRVLLKLQMEERVHLI